MAQPSKVALQRSRSALARRRFAAGLDQRELADISGVRQETISRIETGKVKPRRRTALALAAALNSPPGDLFPALSPETAPSGHAVHAINMDALVERIAQRVVQLLREESMMD
jgi:transcriptional regulator with XRE-family HTH domain